ncbi:MAG: cupredoxin domain-containing protein [Chloroflexi bacterium]|nr:cupredoxin domain-containing protein [Chloroflexota bacterium]
MTRWNIHAVAGAAGLALAALTIACGDDAGGSKTPAASATAPSSTPTRSVATATPPLSPTVPAPPTSQPEPSATAMQVAPTATSPAAAATPELQPTLAPPPPPPGGGATTATVAAVNTSFSPGSLTLPAGATVTLTFDNQDDGVSHDITIFDPAGAQIAATDLGTGPVVQTVTFTLGGPGSYSFKCSIHPQQMRGFIRVQ